MITFEKRMIAFEKNMSIKRILSASEACKLPSVTAKLSCTQQCKKRSLRTLAATAFG